MVESKARMPEMNAQRLCMDAKPTKRSFKGKDIVQGEGIVRFLKRLWEWKGSVKQSLKVCDACFALQQKNRVLYRTRLILTVDILFWRYPLAVLLYRKVKMRCQLRLAFDSPCNAYLLTGFDIASLFDLKRLVKSAVMRFAAVAVIYHLSLIHI